MTVERPLRLRVDLDAESVSVFRAACDEADEEPMANLVNRVAGRSGPGPHLNFNAFMDAVEADADKHNIKLTVERKKLLQADLAKRDEKAVEVISKIHKPGKAKPDPLRGLFEATVDGKPCVVEYEPDTELRDTRAGTVVRRGWYRSLHST